MAALVPPSRLKSADLPTLGRPTTAIFGSRCTGTCFLPSIRFCFLSCCNLVPLLRSSCSSSSSSSSATCQEAVNIFLPQLVV
eukprot:829021-Pyramimonas_sp.AAC.1